MKYYFRKTVSAFLCIVLFGSLCIHAASVENKSVPIVYLAGKSAGIIEDKNDPSSPNLYPSTDELIGAILDVTPDLLDPLITMDWETYCDLLYGAITPVFSPFACDRNGNAKGNSGVNMSYINQVADNKDSSGQYGLYGYVFSYDWRLDPLTAADDLHTYITNVKSATGSDKVCLVGTCFGADIEMAYLEKYGSDDIQTAVLHIGTCNGISYIGSLFAGQLATDGDSLTRFINYKLDADGTNLSDLLSATVSLLNENYSLELPLSYINFVIGKVKNNVVPRILADTFATMPGFWATVSDEYFGSAMSSVFAGRENENAVLIARINDYHTNVMMRNNEILLAARANGANTAVVAKYGFQLAPVTTNNDLVADNLVALNSASFGATTSTVDGTLGKDYIQAVSCPCGRNHVSADGKVDASTCLFPDSTWIIKNMEHADYPEVNVRLLETICRFDGQMTVYDNPAFPQFTVYDRNQPSVLTPLTADNSNTEPWPDTNIFTALRNFIKALFAYIKETFSSYFSK